jgi:hypothetical protein
MAEPGNHPPRSEVRQFVALIVITAATAQALGLALKMPTQIGANDISRWCTVWSLLERGTYAIDDCPWQSRTQDKVQKSDKLAAPGAGSDALTRFEYAIAPKRWREGDPIDHFYSSKPPLLPTIMAGLLYPARKLSGVPLDHVIKQERSERWVQKDVPGSPGKTETKLEKPPEPVEWPVHVFYLKPMLLLLNIVPLWLSLVLYARLLDRYAANDWAWFFSLIAAAFGSLLFAFATTLNNHTVAAASAFFAIYALVRIWDDGERSGWYFAMAGFFGAFCACNEIPAAFFGVLLFLMLLARFPRKTLAWFVPAAAIPCIAFLLTQYLAFGKFRPVYEEFGTKSYNYYGSYWTTPLEMDYLNLRPEPYPVYLFHMTFGHHGVFSLTPVFLFAIYGALRLVFGNGKTLRALSILTLVLLVALVGFYIWHPSAMYYRWDPKAFSFNGLMNKPETQYWLIPLCLVVAPLLLFALVGTYRLLADEARPMRALAALTLVLTVVLFAFYTWNPKARNYGGSTQGLRWLFWLMPLWLVFLPRGVEAGETRVWVRRLSLAALFVSVFSVGYALRGPWSHPWILDALEHLNMYTLKR